MKNGKRPTLAQKKEMKNHGLVHENWLVVKSVGEYLEVINKADLKRNCGNKKQQTRKLYRE